MQAPASSDDVVVLGGGPAGRALAGECARRGMRTVLVDPAPERPWRATYGAWSDELPAGLPAATVGARVQAVAFGTRRHRLHREYAVVDTAALRAHLDDGLAGVRTVAARAARVDGGTVTLGGAGGELRAAVVVDATGDPGTLRPAPQAPRAEQSAYGVVVPASVAAPVLRPGEMVFMDWRADHGRPGGPTFLYALPYGDGQVLLEETSLAARPALGLGELRTRLHARLHAHGVTVGPDAPVERVRFPLDAPRAPARPVAFGAATPLVHPASGFSVAAALGTAPRLADALCAAPGSSGDADAVLWPPSARVVHAVRRHGLRTVLALPPELVPGFFDAFFRLPAGRAHAFLAGRTDVPGTFGAMAHLFVRATPAVRGALLRSAVPTHPLGRPRPMIDYGRP